MSARLLATVFVLFTLLNLSINADGKAVPAISYLDDIELSYENGIWQCDTITCPKGIYGCQILRHNHPQKKEELLRINICYHENGAEVLKVMSSQKMSSVRQIDINVRSFVGAESLYVIGSGLNSQHVNGIVAADDWPAAQEHARRALKGIDESNGGFPAK